MCMYGIKILKFLPRSKLKEPYQKLILKNLILVWKGFILKSDSLVEFLKRLLRQYRSYPTHL